MKIAAIDKLLLQKIVDLTHQSGDFFLDAVLNMQINFSSNTITHFFLKHSKNLKFLASNKNDKIRCSKSRLG